ncbi:MAG TPA: hypothetical protein VE778_02410 [Candidatus Bathyarchaeia archaeon]|nr:hypothetical protein [Candidatus Bathyarchaeia archaeon]
MKKTVTLVVLAILFTADVVLAFYATKWATQGPQSELAGQKAQAKLLRADIRRAREIQQSIPQTKADCERFEESLLSSSVGYSAVTAELTEIAKNSGLQAPALGFHSKELPDRGVVEIELDVTVSSDYKGVVRFVNGLQRSKNHYIIDGLTLASEPTARVTSGPLRVALHLKSYFKNAA